MGRSKKHSNNRRKNAAKKVEEEKKVCEKGRARNDGTKVFINNVSKQLVTRLDFADAKVVEMSWSSAIFVRATTDVDHLIAESFPDQRALRLDGNAIVLEPKARIPRNMMGRGTFFSNPQICRSVYLSGANLGGSYTDDILPSSRLVRTYHSKEPSCVGRLGLITANEVERLPFKDTTNLKDECFGRSARVEGVCEMVHFVRTVAEMKKEVLTSTSRVSAQLQSGSLVDFLGSAYVLQTSFWANFQSNLNYLINFMSANSADLYNRVGGYQLSINIANEMYGLRDDPAVLAKELCAEEGADHDSVSHSVRRAAKTLADFVVYFYKVLPSVHQPGLMMHYLYPIVFEMSTALRRAVVELADCKLLVRLHDLARTYKDILPAMKEEKLKVLKRARKSFASKRAEITHKSFNALECERVKNECSALSEATESLQKMIAAWSKVYSMMADLEFQFSQAMHATSLLHNMGRVQVGTPEIMEIAERYGLLVDDARAVVERATKLADELVPLEGGAFRVELTDEQLELLKTVYFGYLPEDCIDEIVELPLFSCIPGFHLPLVSDIEKMRCSLPFEFARKLRRNEVEKYLRRGTVARDALAAVWHPFDFLSFYDHLAKRTDRSLPMLLPSHTCSRFLALEHLTKLNLNAGRGKLLDEFLIATPSQLQPPVGEYTEKELVECTIKLAWQYWRMAFGTCKTSISIIANRDMTEVSELGDLLSIITSVRKYKPIPMAGIVRGTELFSILMQDNTDLLIPGEHARFSTPKFNVLYTSVLCNKDPLFLAREFGASNSYDWFSRMDWFNDTIATRSSIEAAQETKIFSMVRIQVLKELKRYFEQHNQIEAQIEYMRHIDTHRKNAKMVAGWFDFGGVHKKQLSLVLSQLDHGIEALRLRSIERRTESVDRIGKWWRHSRVRYRIKVSLRSMLTAVSRIENQLRFYFSEENLGRDGYLLEKIHPVLGVVPYPILQAFPILMSQLCFFADQVAILKKVAARVEDLEVTPYGLRRTDWPTGYVPSEATKYAYPISRLPEQPTFVPPGVYNDNGVHTRYYGESSYWY